MLSTPRTVGLTCALTLLLTAASGPAGAVDRLVRHFETGPVRALVEDGGGLLWIGTDIGLFSMDQDGLHQTTDGPVAQLALGPRDSLLVVSGADRRLERYEDGESAPVLGPRGTPIGPLHSFCFAGGDLWIIEQNEHELWRRSGGAWTKPLEDVPDLPGPAWRVSPADDGVFAAVDDRLWHIADDGDVTALAPTQRFKWIKQIDGTDEGGLVFQAGDGVWTLGADEAEAVRLVEAPDEDAGRGFVRRDGIVWAMFVNRVLAVRPDGLYETLPGGVGMPRGGSAGLIDREGSLWIGGMEGLFQLPAPETVVLTPDDGFPRSEPRHVGLVDGGVQVTTWDGRVRVTEDGAGWNVAPRGGWQRGRICEDADGFEYVMSYEDATERRFVLALDDGLPIDDSMDIDDVQTWRYGCTAASAGGIWLVETAGIFSVAGPHTEVVRHGDAPSVGYGPSQAVEDDDGVLWAAFDHTICGADSDAIRAGTADWTCEDTHALVHGLAMTDSGDVWVATAGSGVLARTDDGWGRLPASEELQGRLLHALVPSPRGGLWIVGSQILQRVEGGDDGGPWTVREDLTEWHGVPAGPHYDLAEDDEGGVWIASGIGTIHVPSSARLADVPAPILRRRGVRLDGVAVPVEDLASVAPNTDQLEVELSVRSRRAPALLRYRFQPAIEAPWRSLGSRPGTLLADLSPGSHHIRLNARIEGAGWGEPVEVSYRVLPPWYLRTRTFAGAALLLLGLGFGLHRFRLGLLREALAMREQVARDVHDELKPELGAMVLLAGQLQLDGVPEELAHELAERIEQIGVSRQAALSDTEWALTATDPSIAALAGRLTAQARGLFPDGGTGATLMLELPSPMPSTSLTLAGLVAVQRIGAEAMHNVARHAHADRVWVQLRPEGKRWRLTVRDDGRGLADANADDAHGGGSGLGLDSMRRRAEAIGATLAVVELPGGGTSATLMFDARGDGWLRRLLLSTTPRAQEDPHGS